MMASSREMDEERQPKLYDAELSGITGFLIDLDGTMYRPGGLIDGAEDFYSWLVQTGKQFVFLSNTGAKGSQGVQKKFLSEKYRVRKT